MCFSSAANVFFFFEFWVSQHHSANPLCQNTIPSLTDFLSCISMSVLRLELEPTSLLVCWQGRRREALVILVLGGGCDRIKTRVWLFFHPSLSTRAGSVLLWHSSFSINGRSSCWLRFWSKKLRCHHVSTLRQKAYWFILKHCFEILNKYFSMNHFQIFSWLDTHSIPQHYCGVECQ